MDRSRVAEFVLSSVLSADRAAAAIGDFVEEAGERGSFWFWSSVIRTAVSHVAGEFTTRPLGMLRTGVFGWMLSLTGPLLLAAVLNQLRSVIGVTVTEALFSIGFVAWRVLFGRAIARLVEDRAIATCIAIALVGWVWILVLMLGVTVGSRPYPVGFAAAGARDLLLISGALWARIQRQRTLGQVRG